MYLQHNVYIHPCNECQRWSQALHLTQCVLCGKESNCYDDTIQVPVEIAEEVAGKIFELNQD